MERRWYTALKIITLTNYVETVYLLQKQRISPKKGLEAAVSMLKQWAVFLEIMLGSPSRNLAVYEITLLIEVVDEVSTRLRAQD